jgi:hypothetical protein
MLARDAAVKREIKTRASQTSRLHHELTSLKRSAPLRGPRPASRPSPRRRACRVHGTTAGSSRSSSARSPRSGGAASVATRARRDAAARSGARAGRASRGVTRRAHGRGPFARSRRFLRPPVLWALSGTRFGVGVPCRAPLFCLSVALWTRTFGHFKIGPGPLKSKKDPALFRRHEAAPLRRLPAGAPPAEARAHESGTLGRLVLGEIFGKSESFRVQLE